ncbi:methyl-accepting chemotaxis protein [Geomonas sp. RF6]|uniref:methyl-accepting chemotaxis protein n=1 Tax=Geomonas sp. RF6 TaxID=2897342 RepID=UPI001E5D1CA2|nr:methyl-accepting chemotaxis protein [Geomonas sp. RF6]UFS70201.1 methyl-accepting chemotaxis protein [Geomonas sp. RF6]
MSIKARIGLFVGVVIAFSLVLGVGAFFNIRYLSAKTDETNMSGVLNTRRLATAQDAMWKLRFGVSQYLAVPDPASRKKIIDESPKWFGILDENLKLYQEGNLSDGAKAALKKLTDVYAQYREARPKWFALMEAGKIEEAAEFRSKTILISGAGTVKALDNLIDEQKKLSDSLAATSKAAARSALLAIGIIGALGIVTTIAIGLWIIRGFNVPVTKVLEGLENLRKGDLNLRCPVTSGDEIGTLAAGLNEAAERIAGIIRQISETASQVSTSSSQLHATAGRIAAGSEGTSNEISTVAAASHEMMVVGQDIAKNCLLVADSASRASDSAASGATVVKDTIDGMERISEQVRAAADAVEALGSRSEQIGAIVGTIEDIADQTNLLALNAAIEAARAGEQGRGFAVVADEVRALAERTTKATREVGAMIKSIQTETREAVSAMELGVAEVAKGTSASVKSGEALESILQQINGLSMQINQIAIASEEQDATVREITQSIQNISEIVHTTSRGSSEIATEASELSRGSDDLRRLVGQFRL